MKKLFQYYGMSRSKHYFAVITDDERGLNQQGVDVCWHYFEFDEAKRTLQRTADVSALHTSMTLPNGTTVPSIANTVTDKDAVRTFSSVQRLFHPLFDDIDASSVVGHREPKDLFALQS